MPVGFFRQAVTALPNMLSKTESIPNTASWARLRVTASNNNQGSPPGLIVSSPGDHLIASTGQPDGSHYVRQFFEGIDGQTYVFSCYVKRGWDGSQFTYRGRLLLQTNSGITNTFNLQDGTFSLSGNAIDGGLIDVGGDWYRAWVAGSNANTSSTRSCQVGIVDATGDHNFVAADESLGVWGAMLQTGTALNDYQTTDP